jgi:outer membrane immunogenic protein
MIHSKNELKILLLTNFGRIPKNSQVMRKLTLTFCALFVVFAVAPALFADDGPEKYSGKEMKQVAPAPPPGCFDWSGGYVGGFGGYKFSVVNQNLTLTGDWLEFPDVRALVENRGSGNLDNDGGELGGLVGYNWQSNCWVLGLEASGAYLWARDSHDSGDFDIRFGEEEFDTHVSSAFKTHYLFTFGPRLGYAFGRWLPYVTGGLAVGDLDYEHHIIFTGDAPGNQEGAQDRTTNAGWMVGGGLQYALTDHWSVRVQYQYIDLGSITIHGNFRQDAAHDNFDAPANSEASLREHNASFAIIYKF